MVNCSTSLLRRTTLPMFLLAALAGCPRESPEDQRGAGTDSPAVVPDTSVLGRTTECTNTDMRYRIEYPAAWQTNTGDVVSACSLFDPDSIRVPPYSELPYDIAVAVRREQVDFDTLTGPQLGSRELSREATTVAGRPAVRRELESTGEGLLPQGRRAYQYVIDLDGASLILATHDIGDLPYAEKRRVLDAMVGTLRFTGG